MSHLKPQNSLLEFVLEGHIFVIEITLNKDFIRINKTE